MIGTRIPTAKRLANSVAPLDPNDMTEANANNMMFLIDLIASGEYIQDFALLQRHLSQLMGHEQNTPNLTLRVEPGTAWFGLNSYVTFAGGNCPTIAAPSANPRRDVVTIRSDGSLYTLAGVEAAVPVAPFIPSTDVAIAQVYCVPGMVRVRDNDEQEAGQGYIEYDLRPLFSRPLGADAMPRIGLVQRVTGAVNPGEGFDSGWVTVLDFAGSGRVNTISLASYKQTNISQSVQHARLTIDGTIFINFSIIATAPGVRNLGLRKNVEDQASSLIFVEGTLPTMPLSSPPPRGVDLFFFKNQFKLELRVDNTALFFGSGGAEWTYSIDYEHE